MASNTKVLVLPNICGIEIDLTGTPQPSVQPSLQSFYNTYVQNAAAQAMYFSPSKVRFSEQGKDTRAGMIFTQKLQLQFPSNDPLRAVRIQDYLKAKYIYIKLSSSMVFHFGRNDYFQNTNPKTEISSDEKTTQIIYSQESGFPLGFTNGSFDFQLSEDFPINFYNL